MAKHCRWCGETKPIDAFYKHPQMKEGRLNKCKECQKKSSTTNRLKNLERVREYDRKRAKLPHRWAAGAAQSRKARARNPNYQTAHNAVARAIKAGTLLRSQCQVCGRKTDVQAHHEDYEKPLDVMWLCPPCHHARHQQLKQE